MRVLVPNPTDSSAGVPEQRTRARGYRGVDLHGFYSAGWLGAGGVRMDFVASVDGAATADGRSRGLQTPGDNAVFDALRDLADVIVVGAGTARDEGYGPACPNEPRRALRREFGLASIPPIAVVSHSLRLDPSAALFTAADSSARTIVITCAAADADTLAALSSVADVLVCGDAQVDLTMAVNALRARGLTRILSEGGPSLFGDFAAAGIVDELCLSISPLLAGPGQRRIIDTLGAQGHSTGRPPLDLTLTGLLEEDSALFARYAVTDSDAATH